MNLPNAISLGRLCVVPITVWLIMIDRLNAAFVVFVIAGLSDAVDGYIARRFDAHSELGRYLDPIADKALLVSVYVTLGAGGLLPIWIVILVVFRDLMIVGGVILMHTLSQRFEVAPARISKLNTAAQIVLAATVLARHGLGLGLGPAEAVMLLVVAGTTLVSGLVYLVEWARRLSVTEPAE